MIDGLTYTDANHEYRLHGVVIPSVTQAIELVGASDYSGANPRVLAEAARRGTFVHFACQLDDEHDLDDTSVPPEWMGYVEAWRKFRAESGVVIEATEELVCNVAHRYAGRLDRRGLIGARRWIIDLKTGGPMAWHALQLAGYDAALDPDEKRGRMSVCLAADGSYRCHIHRDPHDRATFLAAVRVAHWHLRQRAA